MTPPALPPEPPPVPEGEGFPWRLWHFFVALVGGVIAGNVVFAFLAVVPEDGVLDIDAVTADELFGIVIPMQHVGTLAVIALIVLGKRSTFGSALGFELDLRHIVWLAIGIGVAIAAALLMVPIAAGLGVEDNPQRVVEQFEEVGSGLPLLMAALTLVVLTPITEEILYRGVLQRAVSRWLSTVPMIVVTSIIWGAAHLLDPVESDAAWWATATVTFVPITIFGALAAIVTVRSQGQLGRAIFLHGGWNLLGVIALIAAQV